MISFVFTFSVIDNLAREGTAQLTDVEQEVNGLLTYDRKPKFDAKEIKAINDLVQ